LLVGQRVEPRVSVVLRLARNRDLQSDELVCLLAQLFHGGRERAGDGNDDLCRTGLAEQRDPRTSGRARGDGVVDQDHRARA